MLNKLEDLVSIFLPIFLLLFLFFSTYSVIYLMWRAVKALEKIAEQNKSSHKKDSQTPPGGEPLIELQTTKAKQQILYKKFIDQSPDHASLPAKERHKKFREWTEENNKQQKDLEK